MKKVLVASLVLFAACGTGEYPEARDFYATEGGVEVKDGKIYGEATLDGYFRIDSSNGQVLFHPRQYLAVDDTADDNFLDRLYAAEHPAVTSDGFDNLPFGRELLLGCLDLDNNRIYSPGLEFDPEDFVQILSGFTYSSGPVDFEVRMIFNGKEVEGELEECEPLMDGFVIGERGGADAGLDYPYGIVGVQGRIDESEEGTLQMVVEEVGSGFAQIWSEWAVNSEFLAMEGDEFVFDLGCYVDEDPMRMEGGYLDIWFEEEIKDLLGVSKTYALYFVRPASRYSSGACASDITYLK